MHMTIKMLNQDNIRGLERSGIRAKTSWANITVSHHNR